MNAYTIKRSSIRRAVVDAAGKHLSPKSAADVCRALLDPRPASEDPVLRAVGLADYFLVRLRSKDAVLDLLADTLDELATQPTNTANELRLRAHELRIAGLERRVRDVEAAQWRAEHGV